MSSNKVVRLPPHFPVELKDRILYYTYADDGRCVYEVFCPEWKLCGHDDSGDHEGNNNKVRLEEQDKRLRGGAAGGGALLGSKAGGRVRFDTFIVPGEGEESRKIKTVFGHGSPGPGREENDHECLPFFKADPRGFDAEGRMPVNMKRQLVREWVDGSLVVVKHKASDGRGRLEGLDGYKWSDHSKKRLDEGVIRDRGVERLVPGSVDLEARGGREGEGMDMDMDILPSDGAGAGGDKPEFLYKRIRHLCINTWPRLMRIAPLEASNPGNREVIGLLQRRLEWEWRATFGLDWVRMAALDRLWVDLRIWSVVSGGPRGENVFFKGVMSDLIRGLRGKGLKVLVIAGLESYEWGWRGDEDAGEVAKGKLDEESGMCRLEGSGRVNWFKTFRGAVRPGGRLVFVNREDDPLVVL